MKIELDLETLCYIMRDDIKEYLGYDGLDALLDFYNELEDANGEPMMYDQSLFWCWDRGELAEIYINRFNEEDYNELVADTKEEADGDEELAEELLTEKMEDYLRYDGWLVKIDGSDEYLYNNGR